MPMNEMWLVRHGESVGNVAASRAHAEGAERIEIELRDADVPLSPAGEEQAAALGRWLAPRRGEIDVFWSSPYVRARETLVRALGESEPPAQVLIDERLRDRELGILDLLTQRGVARFYPEERARRLRLGKFYHRPPGGESWADVALRLRSFLRDALQHPAERGLVVAHDAVVMLLLYVLLPMREEELLEFASGHTVLNASVTHLVRDRSGWRLEAFSDVEHLQREGAAVTVHPGSPDVEPR